MITNDIFEDAPKKRRKPREASFWQQFKQALKTHRPKWSATRLESRVTHGVPDVLLLDSEGQWHLVELKTTDRNKVDISPHQVAFASKHAQGSCWTAVKSKTVQGTELYLYSGYKSMDLRMDGLKTKADFYCTNPFDWEAFFHTLETFR